MNYYLMRALLTLYPRAWRDRYGAEVASLTDELISAGEITPLLAALNLLGGAALEWGRVLTDSRRAALAMTVAAITAVAGSFLMTAAGIFYVASHARPQSAPASVPSASSPVAVRPSVGCTFRAVPSGNGYFQIAYLQIAAEIHAAAKPGQFSWILVPATILVPGKLSIETWPLPTGAPVASPRPSPAAWCVMLLNPSSAGWTVHPAPELIFRKPS
jgi:hypothetical protein